MRFKFKTMLAALVAALALTALAAATASAALPEFVPSGSPHSYSFGIGLRGSAVTLEREKSEPIICNDREGSPGGQGLISGASEVSRTIMTFTNCWENEVSNYPCYNNATDNGIETEALIGKLGYVKKEPTKIVGLKLEGPEIKVGVHGPIAKTVKCFGPFGQHLGEAQITGVVYGSIGPLNKSVTSLEVRYEQSKSKQSITSFEGELKGGHLTWEVATGLQAFPRFEQFIKGAERTNIEIKA
jgi:hypothetical protein